MRQIHIRISDREREQLENFVKSKGIDPDALAYGTAVALACEEAQKRSGGDEK